MLLWGPGLKGSRGEVTGTKDSREMPAASCQSPVTLQRGTSAKGQQWVEERALELLEPSLVLCGLSPGLGDIKGNFL